jgi:hypothetical protein
MPFGGPGTVRVDYAATFTARMPTDDELARGYPAGAPVLVIDCGGPNGSQVLPHYIGVTVGDPHGAPEPDAVRDAAVYVLGIIGERLGNLGADLGGLAGAFGRSPCSVVDLAGEVREEEAAAWRCADAGMCVMTRPE